MAYPEIDDLPPAPQRTDTPADFSAKADALIAALQPLVTQMNAAGEFVESAEANIEDLLATAGFTGSSTTSLVIGTGAKALSMQPNLSFGPGVYVAVADRVAPTVNLMIGIVSSYNRSTGALGFDVPAGYAFGSGTKVDWVISISGPPGPAPSNAVLTTGAQDITGRKAVVGGTSGMATATTGLGAFEVRAGVSGAAMVEVNRNGVWRGYIGVDTDNVWKVGGGSMGAVAYKLWHEGNDGSGSGLDADLLRGQALSVSGTANTVASRDGNGATGFQVVDTPVVRNSAGNVQIQYGTTTRFTVYATGVQITGALDLEGQMNLFGTASSVQVRNAGNTPCLTVNGTTGEVYGHFNGNFNDVYIRSDRRLKEGSVLLDDNIGAKLDMVPAYTGRKKGEFGFYFIADEVDKAFPELVNTPEDPEEYQTVNYLGMVPLLLAEVQNLRKRVSELENDRT